MVNVVQQGLSRNYYNVWEDVDLTKMVGCNTALEGNYLVHSLTGQSRKTLNKIVTGSVMSCILLKIFMVGF